MLTNFTRKTTVEDTPYIAPLVSYGVFYVSISEENDHVIWRGLIVCLNVDCILCMHMLHMYR